MEQTSIFEPSQEDISLFMWARSLNPSKKHGAPKESEKDSGASNLVHWSQGIDQELVELVRRRQDAEKGIQHMGRM